MDPVGVSREPYRILSKGESQMSLQLSNKSFMCSGGYDWNQNELSERKMIGNTIKNSL